MAAAVAMVERHPAITIADLRPIVLFFFFYQSINIILQCALYEAALMEALAGDVQ